jgi:hypothetical protein
MKIAKLMLIPSLAVLVLFDAGAAASHAPQEPTLADLAWLAGHWSVELGPTRVEEVWLAPAGGFLLGMNRTVPKSGSGQFEYLRIEQREDGIVYVASPGGRTPTDFPLADFGKDFVLFANPEHDFPKEIRYELTKDGLRARVSGDADGKEQAEEWTWKRVE